ncbi:pentapeptide repeat-containing protein [Buchananella felis]|uniref:pentapeptide repeat-containing protein n=1 Tax=Buchananella felis TaxID=3231492 RepID=UPI00352858F6
MTRDGYHAGSGSEWADKTSEEKERIFRAKLAALKAQTEPARRRVASLLAPLDFLVRLYMYLFRATLRHLKAWFHRWPLFLVIAFWVTVGLSALTGLFGLWAYNSATANSPTGSPQAIKKACFDAANGFVANLQCVWKTAGAGPDTYEAMKLALAVIGGIGGVAFLVIKYRTRASQEREEARADRREAEAQLVAAVEQLGSEFPQVRIAGVYALADVADAYLGDYKQRVVNILCGYLRTTRGKFVERKAEKDMVENADVKTGGSKAQRFYESDDGPVESTILEVLASHLHKQDAADTQAATAEATPSWSECQFDLHGACFIEPLNFKSRIFIGDITFKECHFAREVSFSGSIFTGWARFDGSTFTGRARFHGSTFNDWAIFYDSTFNDEASFDGSTFRRQASFNRSTFKGEVTFDGSTFKGGASFYASTFNDEASFDGSTLTGRARFDDSAFNRRAQDAYINTHGHSPFGPLLPAGAELPLGARWDDDPAP